MTARIPAYAALVALVALAARWLGWNGTQVLATSIFAGFIAGTLLFWKFRLAFALFIQRDGARELVERRVDWWTLAIPTLLLTTLALYLQIPWMR